MKALRRFSTMPCNIQ